MSVDDLGPDPEDIHAAVVVRADAIAGRIPGALCLGGALKPKVRINPNALAQWGCPIPTQTNENATPSAFAGDDEVAFLKGTA